MRVHWATDFFGVGNSYGYAVHNDRSREALGKLGVVYDDSSPIAMHVSPPHMFEPIPGKKNICFSAWEASQLPDRFDVLKDADAICLTASFLMEPFKERFPGKPIFHVPLGVDTETFKYVDRSKAKYRPNYSTVRNRPFRFLWLGAPNARKGPLHVMEAWRAFADAQNVELYMKTTCIRGEHDQAPDIKRIGNVIYDSRRVPFQELAGIYNHAHCFLFPSVGEGFGLCVHPSTELETPDGRPTKIKNIKVGDLVMNKEGGFSKVQAVVSRRPGRLFEVRVANVGRVYVTAEHPFLASDGNKQDRARNLGWRNVSQLKPGNCVAIAKAKLHSPLPDRIDLGEIAGVQASESEVWFKMGFSPNTETESYAEIASRLGETKKVVEKAVRSIKSGDRLNSGTRSAAVAEQLLEEGYEPAQPKRYARFIEVDEDFLEFLGWYIAEGSSRERACLELSCGTHDIPRTRKLVSWLRKTGGVVNEIIEGKNYRITVCHGPLASWVRSTCGAGAGNKEIPSEFYRAGIFLNPLVKTLFQGDGGNVSNGQQLTTKSKKLAFQVRQILSGLSILAGIKRDKRTGCYKVSVGGLMAERLAILTELPFERLKKRKTDRAGAAAYDCDEYLLAPIRSIKEIKYGGKVYDIQVENSHSFMGNGMILHNTMSEAMSTGLPVIYTPATAMLDLAPPELKVGYPIKYAMKWEDWSWGGPCGDNLMAELATPDTYDLAVNMAKVLNGWPEALARGRRAADRIRNVFTWENTGRKLKEVLEMFA